jgi:Bacterial Ig-like domain
VLVSERTEKTARRERTESLSVFSVFSVLSLLACARIEPPPGGPPDRAPPRLIAIHPDSFAVLRGFKGDADFQFDEVISEGGTPNRGEGTGGLEKLIVLSPTTNVPDVRWRRSRISVRPKEGWRPNRVYRVQLLPGVTDLRNNRSEQGAVLTFTTGAPRPQNILQGVVVDWSTSRPAAGALVIAALMPESLAYRGVADSGGRFSLGPIPAGDYVVSGVLDQNQNLLQDGREAYAVGRIQRGRSEVGELWAFVHDTSAPRIQTVTVNDSVSATVAFSQKLDPRQRLTPRDVRLRILPDSAPTPVASILPKPVDDSLNHRTTRADSAGADTLGTGDSVPARPQAPSQRRGAGPGAPARSPENEALTSRPALFDQLVLRVPHPWRPGSRMVLEVRGLRNVSGVAGNPVGVVAVPEKPKPTPKDTSRVHGRPDTSKAAPRQPPRKPQ